MAHFSGGTEVNWGIYTLHIFTSSGTLVKNASGNKNVDVLIIGGGGAGGYRWGGGGAGGHLWKTAQTISSTNTTITVGAGGVAGTDYGHVGGNGGDSVFAGPTTWTAVGGGGGGAESTNSAGGGSAGGRGVGGSSGSATAGQGNVGGAGHNAGNINNAGGGGGGAGGAGGNASSNVGGAGGAGIDYSANVGTAYGVSGFFCGGGGGSEASYPGGAGGSGGGGAGGNGGNAGVAGTANTGGGGGGGGDATGGSAPGAGGSGIVIVRYLIENVSQDAPVANVTFTGQDAVFVTEGQVNADVAALTFTGQDAEVLITAGATAEVAVVTFTAVPAAYVGEDLWEIYGEAVLATGDVYLYWRFEETSGTTVEDSSGNGRTGTANSLTFTDDDGHSEHGSAIEAIGSHKALGIDNGSSYITGTRPANAFPLDAPFTLDFWWYCESTAASVTIFDNNRVSSDPLLAIESWSLDFNHNDQTFVFQGYNAAQSLIADMGLDSAAEVGWNHYSLVVNTTTVSLYRSGSFLDSGATTGTVRWRYHSLARQPNGGGATSATWEQHLDEYVVFSKALTAPQIEGIHAASEAPISVNVEALVAAVTFTAQAATVDSGTSASLTADNVPSVTFTGYSVTLQLNGAVIVGADTANILLQAYAPDLTTDRLVEIVVTDPPTISFSAPNPDVRINLGELAFKFIPSTDTSFTALDADDLVSFDLGSVLYGQDKIISFRLGNTSLQLSNFEVSANSGNNLAEMVQFSLNKADWSDTLEIGAVPVNGITDTIWVRLAVTTNAFIDDGSFLIHVEQTNA